MARTIDEINKQILDSIAGTPELAALNSPSKYAIYRLLSYIFATAAWVLETLFDKHKEEVAQIIAAQKAHTARWYASKAKDFQYGDNLAPDADYYDNTGLTEEEVAEAKIIHYSACNETAKGLIMKVATTDTVTGDLGPITPVQLMAFETYMGRIKDAGVRLKYTNSVADVLALELVIYYNPLILAADGSRLDGSNAQPVIAAVNEFLKNQPFNGVFVNTFLVDALQRVEGVVIPQLVLAKAKYGSLPYTAIAVEYLPDAGYMRLSELDTNIQYLPHEPF